VIDGGGSILTAGVGGYLYVPFACTLTAVTLLADQVGSVNVDVDLAPFSGFPPTSSNTIFPSDNRTLSNQQSKHDLASGTDWVTAFPAGSTLGFAISAISAITRLTIALTVVG
jgi:hypothetical protein